MPLKPGKAPSPSFLNSNSQHVLEDLQYTSEDIKHIENWTKRTLFLLHTHASNITLAII
jgi:alcohol oxidase